MAYNSQLYMPQPYFQQYQQPMQYQQQYQQTRIIEVVPVDSEEAAETFPVAVGATQVMFSKDDSFIAVKSVGVNGQSSFQVYVKRPKPAPKPAYDLSDYVTKDELNERLKALTTREEAEE